MAAKHVRDYKRGKLVSYVLNNAAKTCLHGLKLSENIDIEHVFQSKVLLVSVAFSAFKFYTFCYHVLNSAVV